MADLGRRERVVVDTSVLIAGLLDWSTVSGRAAQYVVDKGQLIVSKATLAELARVTKRRKFNAYLSFEDRRSQLLQVIQTAELVEVVTRVRVCSHPSDDKFLALAVDGKADCVLSADRDFLRLLSYRGIPIVDPESYLASRGGVEAPTTPTARARII